MVWVNSRVIASRHRSAWAAGDRLMMAVDFANSTTGVGIESLVPYTLSDFMDQDPTEVAAFVSECKKSCLANVDG